MLATNPGFVFAGTPRYCVSGGGHETNRAAPAAPMSLVLCGGTWRANLLRDDWFAAFLCTQAGYAEPTPVEPRDEAAELQRAFIRSVAEQKALLERLQRVQVRAAS